MEDQTIVEILVCDFTVFVLGFESRPLYHHIMKLRFLAAIIAIPSLCFGQVPVQDAQPMDVKQLIEALKLLREQNETGIKARKQQAYTRVMAAAASGSTAVAFWKEAVKEVQFDGASHQGSKLSEWRDGDGDALSSKECQTAVRLHLYWLGLSLQHAMGTETKAMLQNVIDFTKQVRAEDEAMIKFDNALERAKERKDRKDLVEDQVIKRVHQQIFRTGVGGSPVARWLQLGDLLGADAKRRAGGKNGEVRAAAPRPEGAPAESGGGWEYTPGNVDGIFNAIVLPEFRVNKDPRLLEYWDLKIKTEGERVAEKKLDVEQRDWTQVNLPNLQWARAQDVMLLGQKNRAIGEMFRLVKGFPQHPSTASWISSLEGLILAAAAPAAVAPIPPAAPAGGVVAPVPVPPATAPVPAVDPFRLNPVRPAPTQ